MNLWFQGGSFATIWSFGVAEEIKRRQIDVNFAGGYSAGAGVAAFLLTPRESCYEESHNALSKSKYGPYSGSVFGVGHLLMRQLHEAVLGDCLNFNKKLYDEKLWIPIRGLKSLTGTWRHSWRDYDDLIETFTSTTCIPGIHGEFSQCYYDDFGSRRGPTIDGGLFSMNPPKHWDKSDTLVISPWGNGDLNMKPAAKLLDFAFPKQENLKIHFSLGMRQAREYFDNINI